MPLIPPRLRWLLLLIGVAAGVAFWARLVSLRDVIPYDFAINWTAALAMRQGLSIYDQDKLRELSIANVGPVMRIMYDETFESYIGPPTTAALHIPFTFLPFETALVVCRALILIIATLAVGIAAQALPRQDRWLGLGAGLLALLLLQAFAGSFMVGQVDYWIMLGLGLSLWAASQDRWQWMGVGSGLAGLLKVSPFILLAYSLLRRKFSAVGGAAGAIGLAVLATLPFGGHLWWQFAEQIAPSLSASTLSIENQAWLSYLARIVTAETDLYSLTIPLGPLARLTPVFAALLIVIVHAVAPHQPNDTSLRLSLLILVALMTGPITWDNYLSWAAVALTQFADTRRWQGLSPSAQKLALGCLMIGAILASVPQNILFFKDEVFAEAGWLRLITGPRAIALALWFIAGLMLLRSQPRSNSESPPSEVIQSV